MTTYLSRYEQDRAYEARSRKAKANAADLAHRWLAHIRLKHGGDVTYKRGDANAYVTLNDRERWQFRARTVRKQRRGLGGWVDVKTYTNAQITAVLDTAGH